MGLVHLLMQHKVCFIFSYIRSMTGTSSLVCALLGDKKSMAMKLVFTQADMQQVAHLIFTFVHIDFKMKT